MSDLERTNPDSWEAILEWLDRQHGGLDTYTKFQHFALALADDRPDEAAAAGFLSMLSSRFVEAYDGMPLTQGVAENALQTLKRHVTSIVNADSDGEVLQALNAIARSNLSRNQSEID